MTAAINSETSAPGGHIALVGGTGFEQLPPDIFAEPVEVETRFGVVRILSVANNYVEPYKLYFLSRHGAAHGLPPHRIDYRANTAALLELGVRYVLATNAVGSLRADLPVGAFVLLDDFIDFTRGRPLTFFDTDANWQHVDFTLPYSPFLRQTIKEAAHRLGISLVERGTYLCCDGPRFETPAEVRLFAHWGADVVGMTGIPEVVFAREAGMEYASLAIVTNYGAGVTEETVDHTAVVALMEAILPAVQELLFVTAGKIIEKVQTN
ncbi:MAG TPA: MTAP family purine nucleoside phosphorylase [Chthonomonadaceae bacterium]|nr:MTAP family purine nucleoside phosphorylase [Chthonomonadaceae bacterium]